MRLNEPSPACDSVDTSHKLYLEKQANHRSVCTKWFTYIKFKNRKITLGNQKSIQSCPLGALCQGWGTRGNFWGVGPILSSDLGMKTFHSLHLEFLHILYVCCTSNKTFNKSKGKHLLIPLPLVIISPLLCTNIQQNS